MIVRTLKLFSGDSYMHLPTMRALLFPYERMEIKTTVSRNIEPIEAIIFRGTVDLFGQN